MTRKSQQSPIGDIPASAPMDWVARWLQDVASGTAVLDLACGRGRHARLAAGQGLQVLAVDRDAEALAAIPPPVRTLRCDLENDQPWPFADRRFGAIIVSNYLFRPRLDALCGLLAPGGRLIYATFGMGNERFGRPANPEFLLQPGELLAVCARNGLRVLGFESGRVDAPAPAVVERVCAVRAEVHDEPQRIAARS